MNLSPTYIVTDGSGRANGKDSQAHKTLSSAPVSEPGVGYMTYVQPNGRYGWADTTSSPSYILNTDISQNRTLRMVGNAFLRITPFQDFRVELSAAANYYDLDGNKYSFSSSGNSKISRLLCIHKRHCLIHFLHRLRFRYPCQHLHHPVHF